MNMVLYYNLMQYTLMHCIITIQNRIHNKYNTIQCVKYTLGISHLIRLCVVSESAYMLMTRVIKQIMKKWGAKFVKFQFNPLFFPGTFVSPGWPVPHYSQFRSCMQLREAQHRWSIYSK